MQPSPSKRVRFNTSLISPHTPASSNYSFHHQLSGYFSSSPLLPLLYKNNNPLPYKENNQLFLHTLRPYQPCCSSPIRPYQPHHSSPIGSKRISNLLFAAYHRAEEENKAETGVFSEDSSEVEHSSSKNSDIDDLSSEDEDHWEDEADDFPDRGAQASWIDIGNTSKVKKKLIRILAGDGAISK